MLNLLDTSTPCTADAVHVASCTLAEAMWCSSNLAADTLAPDSQRRRLWLLKSHWRRNTITDLLELHWLLHEPLT